MSCCRPPRDFRKYFNGCHAGALMPSEKEITKTFRVDFWFAIMALQKKPDYELIKKSGRKLQHLRETIDLLHAITGKDDCAERLKKSRRYVADTRRRGKNMDAQSIPEVYYQGGYNRGLKHGIDLGIHMGGILMLKELVDAGDISLEHATRKAKMGTDTARFLETAAQYRKEADRYRSAQSN